MTAESRFWFFILPPSAFSAALVGFLCRLLGRPLRSFRVEGDGRCPQILHVVFLGRRFRLQPSLFGKRVVLIVCPCVRVFSTDRTGALQHGQFGVTQELIQEPGPVGHSDVLPPLTLRPNLSLRIMKRIAEFVASALVRNMVEHADIDEKTGNDLIARTRKRITTDTADAEEVENYQEKARDFLSRGMITDEFIVECAEKRRRQLLYHCMAVKVDMKPVTIENVIRSKNGRAITALVWSAGLRMRTALAIQNKVAMVPPGKIVHAKGGIDFPFDESTMQQDLLFFKE